MKPETLKLLRNIAVVLIFIIMTYVTFNLLNGFEIVFAILAVVGTVIVCGFVGAFGWKWMLNIFLGIFTSFIIYSFELILAGTFNIKGLLFTIMGWIALFAGIPFIVFQYKKNPVVALFIYLLLMVPVMYIYMFVFTCAYFGECL